MKTKLLLSVLIASTMAAASVASQAATPQPASFLGAAAPASAAVDKVVVITDATRHVNVTGGTTVRFVAGERSFTWTFENGNVHVMPFDLARVAPAGLLAHPVMTYVSDNPLYQGS
ncbi:MAG: CzcE family metal-binding protein [Massilia sp.]